jgi:hypothetical protein
MDNYGICVISEVPKAKENPIGPWQRFWPTLAILPFGGAMAPEGWKTLFFPRFLQIYTRRVLDGESIIGGKNGRITFEKAVFGPLWPNAPRRPRLDGLPKRIEARSQK